MKDAETRQAKASPVVSELPHKMKRAGSRTCLCGVECFTLAWCAGLLAAFLFDLRAALLLAAAAVLFLLRLTAKERILLLLGAVCGAILWFSYDAAVRKPLLALDGKQVICTGTITEIRAGSGEKTVCTLRTALNGHSVLIDWYADAEQDPPVIGETVTLDAALSKIQSDYRYHTAEYQAGKGKYLRIYRAKLTDREAPPRFCPARLLHAYRQYITDRITAALPEADAGLLCAMLFGDKHKLSDDTADAFRAAGLSHVTVVSGLHLVFFCSVLVWILRRLRASERMIFLVHIPAILLFILLADSSVSEIRAAVMLLIARSAVLFGRRGDTLRSLCIAMFLCTVTAPYVIGSVSFWLSVSGVFGIGVLAPHLTKHVKGSRLKRNFLSLCCVSAAIVPVSVLLCGESSLLAPVSNLLILPLCTAVICFGFSLLLTGGLTGFLLPLAGKLCALIRNAAELAARLPYSHIAAGEPALRMLLIFACVLILYLMFAGIPRKMLTMSMLWTAALLAGFSLLLRLRAMHELRIAVLGGSKDAALVISVSGETIIADLTDAPRNAQYTARYLRGNGIASADVLVLNGLRAAAGYQAELGESAAGQVILRNGAAWRRESKICGTIPEFCGTDTVTLSDDDYSLQISGEAADLQWGMQHVIICNADETPPADANAVILYGDAAGYTVTINGREYHGNNLLLRFAKDGGAAVSPAG